MAKKRKKMHVIQPKKIESNKMIIEVNKRNIDHALEQINATGVGRHASDKTYNRNKEKKKLLKEIDSYK